MKPNFPHILQTPQWGVAKSSAQPVWTWHLFVKSSGERDWKNPQQIDDWSEIQSSVLILERSLGLGQKLHYIPRGPYVDWKDVNDVNSVLGKIKLFAKEQKALFTRFEPNEFEQNFPYDLVENAGFKRTPDFVQAKDTVKVDIDKTGEELMASFHKKHAYNIRLAQRRGLTVRSSTDSNDVSAFYRLLIETDKRTGGALKPHPERYYQSIVEELGKNKMVKVYIVKKGRKSISASIVFTFGEEAIYMFGASDYKYRRDMPNHLREWQSMIDARDEGRKYFDFWGVTMRNDPGGGIKRYKLGYNDKVEKMAGTFDWAESWWKYDLYNLLNILRRKVT